MNSKSARSRTSPPPAALLALVVAVGAAAPLVQAQQADVQSAAAVDAAAAQQPASDSDVTEMAPVIVTSNRRQEELKKFAGSVTPMTARQLDELGASSFEEYLTRAPGTALVGFDPGLQTVTIRGVGTTSGIDQGQQTTGMFINDIPLTEPVFNIASPDIDTFDVDRVEILRGPQGTSFGSGTLGGAVNYITNRPQFGVVEGRVAVGLSSTYDAPGLGYEAKGMLNLPVGDAIAVRGVFTTREEQGYLDNIGTGERGSNDASVTGARLLADWQIDDDTMLRWMTLYQRIYTDDGSAVYSNLDEFQRSTPFPEARETSILINSLKLEHAFDWAMLDVSLSQHKKTQNLVFSDASALRGQLGNLTPYVASTQTAEPNGYTFESRFTSTGEGPLEWLIGVFYDRTEEHISNPLFSPGAAAAIETLHSEQFGAGIGAVLAPNDVYFTLDNFNEGTETALFGQASLRFAQDWKLTLGGRLFRTEVKVDQINGGLQNFLSTGSVTSEFHLDQKDSGFSPKVVLAYDAGPNTMIYGLVSEGFRYGGVNPTPPDPGFETPRSFDSDSLINYELGLRTATADNRFTADITAFYIDWSDIQVRLSTPSGFAYADNVGDARNIGVEASTTWRPIRGLSWQFAATWLQAELTTDFNPGAGQLGAPAGSTLPGAAEWNVSSIATYRWQREHAPFVTLAYRYQGDAPASLVRPFVRMGNFHLFNLRGGFSVGPVTYTAYVDNLLNEEGVTNSFFQNVSPPYEEQTVLRPLTVGVLADYRF